MLVIPYPQIDPVLFAWGPIAIRWYALAYIAGLLIGWWVFAAMVKQASLWKNPPFNGKPPATTDDAGDLVVWATMGVLLGGRIGYILFYAIALCSVSPHEGFCAADKFPGSLVTQPWKIFEVWQGGMSFHGAAIGVILAIVWFCRRRKLPLFSVGDLVCAVQPIGQFFGRIANFVNGELWGKPSHAPWAMVFPRAGAEPRHPSQLYEAALEGIALFVILQIGIRVFRWQERPGLTSAVFLIFYAVFRYIVEFFREPDAPFLAGVSMGQALSLAFLIGGFVVLYFAYRKPPEASHERAV
ncbi:MAG TPA: prolipoprotein diacylglyceryl transferase [Rhizomicrobium sp.]|jgi:phosphatidylglycerol:prolipoprotein diacylglycerol transferase